MAVAWTSPGVVPTAIKFHSASKATGSLTSKVSVAVSRLGSTCRCCKCASRWSSLRGTRMAHVSWNVIPRKQSSRNALVTARAGPDCSASGGSSLYLDANRVFTEP
ncbi:hypothetical protein M758_12G009400 [Ceratodon purpureus]|nr:hypothetical protein M758_12G009400 [Ceratodon purpureus]